ncbi:type II toxin-antitoxin system VapC family toxin [Anatilimnocola floriformis]|uniref:type II toxin-antitoxin system VapC family toxin n=1 Tax=Anatilimnocola floriformis TaxID=2948575 RepID=UPI0020C388E0|nr:type II toxin-antitoxin system VapC family toxin [Anatilimnocola floriformis]
MKLLLDTHTFLWLAQGSAQLSSPANAAIADPQNELYLSVASIWEIAIKVGIGKFVINGQLDLVIDQWLEASEIRLLDIRKEHVLFVANLPALHRDPFDRLLISQALCEQLTLVSDDSQFQPYAVPLIW